MPRISDFKQAIIKITSVDYGAYSPRARGAGLPVVIL